MISLQKLQKTIKSPMLIAHQPNLRYLVNFTGTTGMLVAVKKNGVEILIPAPKSLASAIVRI